MTAVPLSELSAYTDPSQSVYLENIIARPQIDMWAMLAPTDSVSAGESCLVRRRIPQFAIGAGGQKYTIRLGN